MHFQNARYNAMLFGNVAFTFPFPKLITILTLGIQLSGIIAQSTCPSIEETGAIFGNIKQNKQLPGHALNIIRDVSFLACVKECQLRSHCEAVGYRRLFHECRLYDGKGTLSTVLDSEPQSIYINITALDAEQPYLGACSLRDCQDGFRCKDTGAQKICEPSECTNPSDVVNANLYIESQAVGARGKYVCMDGYTHLGESVITCQPNLTWTDTSLKCIALQTIPEVNLDLIIVTTPMDFDTAKEYCSQLGGGRLIKIDSIEKKTALEPIIRGAYYYIDGSYNTATTLWTFSDGDVMPVYFWGSGEPNYLHKFEYCIMSRLDSSSGVCLWYNIVCSRKQRTICEIEK